MLGLKTAEQLFYILYQGRSLPPSKAKHSTDYREHINRFELSIGI